MTVHEVADFREQYRFEDSAESGPALAELLVRTGKLTTFQAGRVCEGNHLGLVLGNNVLLEKIGSGGMGDVFKAEHRRMKRLVVVKILRAELLGSDYAVRRFEREVRAAAQLSHPNIVTAYDADSFGDMHFLVMEYVEGLDLGTVVNREGPMAVGRAIRYITQTARGLEYAHAKGIVHRDIKPGNLLLDNTGTIKILDMGLARFDSNEEGGSDHLTRENQIIGTVDYMAPEQAQESKHVDRRSDIYSLGCTLYRMVTGRSPYAGESPFMIILAHQSQPLPSLCDVLGSAAEPLDEIFHRMIAKDPNDRFQSITEFLNTISELDELGSSQLRVERPTLSLAIATTPTITMDRPDSELQSPAANRISPKSCSDQTTAYGIDLGTTYSVLAKLDENGRPVTICNAEGDPLTPSMLLFDGDDVIVGKEAVRAMAMEMDPIADSPKRQLGMRYYDKTLHGRSYPPEVLQAFILNRLRLDANSRQEPLRQVVITVPAYFDEIRRKATFDAGRMAGLEVLDVLNEPSAAALAFGFQQGLLSTTGQMGTRRILVYDLGGGTFDVTLMEISGNEFRMLATDGDMRLGGRDWDMRLVDFVAERFVRQYGVDPRKDANRIGRLIRDCEEIKRALSARQRTPLICDYGGQTLRVEITRSQFEELTRDLLDRTTFTIRQTMDAAGLKWGDLDRVLLVGGATRMPAVSQMLLSLTGKAPDGSISADESIAHGAALYAALLLAKQRGESLPYSIHNVNSHSLGVVAAESKTKKRANVVLIRKNTRLPAVHRRVFKTHKHGQQSLLIQIVEGESASPDECAQVGRCTVHGLPPDLPIQTPVTVEFSYSESGRLKVRMALDGKGDFVEYPITREEALSPLEILTWRQVITGDASLDQPLP